jgi:Serpin (serine protease inhibitor)
MYLNFKWSQEFEYSLKERVFHVDHKRRVRVKYMEQTDRFAYDSLDDMNAHIVELEFTVNYHPQFKFFGSNIIILI